MKILMIGDIIGKPGYHAVHNSIKRIQKDHSVDFIVANGENIAGGFGIQPNHLADLKRIGVNVVTSGNHVWSKKEVREVLQDPAFLRPANYPEENPGRGWGHYTIQNTSVAVINLMGRTFLYSIDCPFKKAEAVLKELPSQIRIILVDMHAEATSEKRAMGLFLDGRVSAVVGTHTHVMTADEEILPGGTGYLTDIGMCGALHSVIGMRKDEVLQRFLTGAPQRLAVADGPPFLFQAVLLDVDDSNGKCRSIQRIREIFS